MPESEFSGDPGQLVANPAEGLDPMLGGLPGVEPSAGEDSSLSKDAPPVPPSAHGDFKPLVVHGARRQGLFVPLNATNREDPDQIGTEASGLEFAAVESHAESGGGQVEDPISKDHRESDGLGVEVPVSQSLSLVMKENPDVKDGVGAISYELQGSPMEGMDELNDFLFGTESLAKVSRSGPVPTPSIVAELYGASPQLYGAEGDLDILKE